MESNNYIKDEQYKDPVEIFLTYANDSLCYHVNTNESCLGNSRGC